jgi:hypothetical protein
MTMADTHEHPMVDTTDGASRPLPVWIWLGIGVAVAIVGLLPWIITGMRLPLQNLWGASTLPGEMPIGLLPFSQYSLTLIAGIAVVGSAAAGIVARSLRARQGRYGFAALAAGVLAAQIIEIVQTATIVGNGLRPGTDSLVYLFAVIAAAAASLVVGTLVLFLIARAPRAGALIGLSIAAVAAGWWLDALVVPNAALVSETQLTLLGLAQWVPAILCGLAIAWCGITTIGRGIAAVVAVAAVVIGPAFATGVTSAAGTRVLARYPSEMVDYGVQVFQLALGTPALTLRPLLTAIIVAAVGLALGTVLRRRRLRLR